MKQLEGEQFSEAHDIHVYGPFPSMVELEAMLSNEQMTIGPRERDQITRSQGLYAHYLLVAGFLVSKPVEFIGRPQGAAS